MLCIDLDHFKEVNDLYRACRRGRGAAGSVAAAAGGRARRVRGPGRGDEFIGITDQTPLPASAELVATRMRAAFAEPIEVEGRALKPDLCVGIALFPEMPRIPCPCWRTRTLPSIARSTKDRGAIRLFTSAMDQQLRERRALEHDLRFATERGELYLEYQPQQHRDGRSGI